jgi:CheY-like chemotaxis protein
MVDAEKNGVPHSAPHPFDVGPDYLATLVHDLRNPLAPIRNATELLRSLNTDPRQAHAIEVIERQVVNLTVMLDDLTEAASARRNVFSLKLHRVDLDDIVEPALRAIRGNVDEQRQNLLVSMPSYPVHMHCDPIRLTQALQTLLDNATRHTPEGGAIAVKIAVHDADLTIEVSDNGAGIATEQLPAVFNVFSHGAPANATTPSPGGYSLALLRNVIEMHGGTVSAHSEGVGHGSRFLIRLPLEEALETAPLEAANQPLNARRVLVIDDNPDNAQSLAQVLACAGHSVLTADTGEIGLALAARFKPDAVVVDIGLPGIDGFEVAKQLRAQSATSGAVLIAVSGFSLKQFRELEAYSVFRHYLLKPTSPYTVMAIIENTPKNSAPTK